jgi:hypothetical protein
MGDGSWSDKVYFFFPADGEPVYAGLDSNPGLEPEPVYLAPGIQNEVQPVIS